MMLGCLCFAAPARSDDSPGASAAPGGAGSARAVPADSGQSVDPAVAALTNPATLGLVYLDLTRLDLQALREWQTDSLKAMIADPNKASRAIADATPQTQRSIEWSSAFKKAGGQTLYVLIDPSVLQRIPPTVAAPLAPGADGKSIAGLLESGKPTGPSGAPAAAANGDVAPYADVEAGAVVWADSQNHDQFRQSPGTLRPQLVEAFAAAGDAPVRLVFSPTFATITLLGQAMPDLPAVLGGGPTLPLLNGLKYLSVGLTPPPNAALAITFKCKDEASAENVAGVIGKALDQFRQISPKAKAVIGDPAVLAQGLTPVVNGDTVSISPDAPTIKALEKLLLVATIDARQRADQASAIGNIRQLLLGCYQYANAHGGEFPEHLNIVAGYVGGADNFAKLMTNPAYPEEKDGFTYIKPPSTLGNFPVDTTVVIYENVPATADRVAVGFADGHAVIMTPEQLKAALPADAAKP
jgi:hypothetical protein